MDMSLSGPLRRAILRGGVCRGKDGTPLDATALVHVALRVLGDIDPAMCRHLTTFQRIADAFSSLAAAGEDVSKSRACLCVQGAPIDMLCLDFTLPGDEDFELMVNGREIAVTLENLGMYVRRVCEAMVVEPLENMARGIREGMSSLFDPGHLRCFDEEELELLLCGTAAQWTAHDLHEHVRTDHGFSKDSTAVQQLLSILGSFDGTQQRQFLMFVTGSPRLPVGGLGALRPSLTVVRKMSSSGGSSSTRETSLPSASTCTSYLKLPEYSSMEEMREKLLLAISEGQGAFHLS
jgi:E3 ubiquitin-protein ligase TRIP12